MELTDYVSYATRVAFSIWRDPESESLANIAAWRAYETYREPTFIYGSYTEEGWIARITKQHIYAEWKKRGALKRSDEQTDGWWQEVVSCVDEPIRDPLVSLEDWKLLCEKYIEKWPIDVIARRNNLRISEAKRRLTDALSRFVTNYIKETS